MTKRFPGGKAKAFNITYDDGVLQDVPFVAMLNRYGIRGTFNLNSRLMEEQFSWTHPNGMEVTRLPISVVKELYRGHEVASHTLTHPYMSSLTKEEILCQMRQDKEKLEGILDSEVAGFAVPFSYYSDLIAECARESGFEYARMSEFSGCYTPCREYFFWKPGFYHIQPGLTDFVAGFLNTNEEMAVCQLVGHSYDLDAENLWGTLELICAAVAAREDVWLCTNLELVRYLKAMDKCVITADFAENHSNTDIWLEINGEICVLSSGQRLEFEGKNV